MTAEHWAAPSNGALITIDQHKLIQFLRINYAVLPGSPSQRVDAIFSWILQNNRLPDLIELMHLNQNLMSTFKLSTILQTSTLSDIAKKLPDIKYPQTSHYNSTFPQQLESYHQRISNGEVTDMRPTFTILFGLCCNYESASYQLATESLRKAINSPNAERFQSAMQTLTNTRKYYTEEFSFTLTYAALQFKQGDYLSSLKNILAIYKLNLENKKNIPLLSLLFYSYASFSKSELTENPFLLKDDFFSNHSDHALQVLQNNNQRVFGLSCLGLLYYKSNQTSGLEKILQKMEEELAGHSRTATRKTALSFYLILKALSHIFSDPHKSISYLMKLNDLMPSCIPIPITISKIFAQVENMESSLAWEKKFFDIARKNNKDALAKALFRLNLDQLEAKLLKMLLALFTNEINETINKIISNCASITETEFHKFHRIGAVMFQNSSSDQISSTNKNIISKPHRYQLWSHSKRKENISGNKSEIQNVIPNFQ